MALSFQFHFFPLSSDSGTNKQARGLLLVSNDLSSKSNKSNEPPKAAEAVAAKGGKDAPPEEEAGPPKYTSFTQLLESIGSNRLDNILATFALEYAESRGNLNPE